MTPSTYLAGGSENLPETPGASGDLESNPNPIIAQLAAAPQVREESLDNANLASALESLLFVSGTPANVEQLAKCLDAPLGDVELALRTLVADLQVRGIRLQRNGDELQLVTAPENAGYAERLFGLQLASRLSGAALEALAVVAYRQPVTRAQVEAVRGVNSDGVLNTLATRGLIAEIGRLETAGRPVLFGTTFEFLQHFGLGDLSSLPSVDAAAPPSGESSRPPTVASHP